MISTVVHQLKSVSASPPGLPRYRSLFQPSWSPVALWLWVSRAALPRIQRCRPCFPFVCDHLHHMSLFMSIFMTYFIPGFWLWTNSVFNFKAWTHMTVCSQTSASTGPTRPEGCKPPYLTAPQTGIERSRELERQSGGFAPSTWTTSSHPGFRPVMFFGWLRILFTSLLSEWKKVEH